MYTEGFEGLEEAEKESRRTYGTSSETDRLLRENDRLKKSLEKEKFFNKLLDQEIQDLKNSVPNGHTNFQSDYWTRRRRVSKSAFYALLFISLVMAAYIGYGIYYDKKFDYLELKNKISSTNAAAATPPVTASANSNEQPNTVPAAGVNDRVQNERPPASTNVPPAAVKDSVPNIIGSKKNTPAEKPSQKQRASVAVTPDEEYNEDEVNATLEEDIRPVTRPVNKPARTQPASTQPVSTQPPAASTSTTASTAAATPAESRPVIGRYRITSKANFYNSPDENTMRSTFISESSNKVVAALEDRNGFIFVEYTNDLGFTSKGWLSKKDLAKE